MPPRQITNKLTVYLIKDRFTDPAQILRNIDGLDSKSFANAGTFYYKDSERRQPIWVSKFFQESLNDIQSLYNASANGLLLAPLEVESGIVRMFAVSFGHGWQFLKNGVYEERFGLKVVLNIIDPDSLRKIDKKNMSSTPKDTTEQLSKAGNAADFGIDIEQDLVRAITGVSSDLRFGKTVTGNASLSLIAPVSFSGIQRFLTRCYERYISLDYKQNFGWIDQITEVKDANQIDRLDSQMVRQLRSSTRTKTWMAIPEIVDWVHIQGFDYTASPVNLQDDITLAGFLSSLSPGDRSRMTATTLKADNIYAFSNTDRIAHQWSAYECIYCELADGGNTYLLSNGKWYEVEQEFAALVNAEFADSIASSSSALPVCRHATEPEYNKQVPAEHPEYICLDGDTIRYGGAHSRIEFCDLMSNDKRLIHVKRYGASSVLSHLFSQGLVSGELFLGDKEFREKVNGKLPDHLKFADTRVKPNASEYQIIYGIISDVQGSLDIPFFSKVSFRNAKRRLETFGYRVDITKIAVEFAGS